MEREGLNKIREKLNKTGCGFCAAKWTQVTIHLQTGRTHSCHHPMTHKIPLREIAKNPSALHNTRYKKRQRKKMLDGKRPDECDYCWNIEDSSEEFSDRTYKSSEPWSEPYIDEIKELGWKGDYNPKYVEVAFSNVCNFKCSYCGPSFSSTWVQEIKKHGEYPTTDGFNNIDRLKDNGEMPYHHTEFNPYVEAFWKWWPDLYHDLHTFRITGGEPLLSNDTWKILDYIIDNPNPNRKLKLGINSNLGVPDNLIDKLIEKLKILEERNLVSEIVIHTSCDTAGSHAEYIRNGLDYEKFKFNVDKVLSNLDKTIIGLMSTFNALSVINYKEFLVFVYEMKKKHNTDGRYWQPCIVLDSSYLRYPQHQTVKILPDEWISKVEELADFADNHRMLDKPLDVEWDVKWMGFVDIEVAKIRRIADWMRVPQDADKLKSNRSNFYRFMNAHDERRATDFKKTFPELEEFYNTCKKLNDE
jgi:organic radical activating enzyme